MTERGSVSVSSSTSRIVYAGNNSLVTAYAVPFYFQLSSHLVVVVTTAAGVETTLTEGSGYVVTGAGNPAGGGVVTSTAWNNTHTVTIFREVPATQLTSYADNDAFPAASHEAALDKLTLLVQQAIRKAGTGVRVTEASPAPAPATSVPLSVAGLDASGNTVFRTPAELVEFLSLPGAITDFPGAVWQYNAERLAKVPDYVGQLGFQRDFADLWYSTGTTAGAWERFSLFRISGAPYGILQLQCTTAPANKRISRLTHDAAGAVAVQRIDDNAVATPLISWDANNNCAVGLGAPQAKQHVFAPALSSAAQSVADIARWEINNGNVSSVRLIQVRNSTGGDWTTTTTRFFQATDATAQGFIDFNPQGLTHGLAFGTHHAGIPVAAINLVPGAGTNSVGIGTPNASSKLTVAGDIRLLNNNAALLFTDQSGSTPYFVSAVDGNFYFTGTTSTGAGSSVFRCAMRSDNSPLQIDRPLKIGAAGAEIKSVLSIVVSHAGWGSFPADGVLTGTFTMTGIASTDALLVSSISSVPNNILLSVEYFSANTILLKATNTKGTTISWGTAFSCRIIALTF